MKRAISPKVTERYYFALLEIQSAYASSTHSSSVKKILSNFGVSRVISTKIMHQCLDKVNTGIYVWKKGIAVSYDLAIEFHKYANSTSTKWHRKKQKESQIFQKYQISETQSITYIRNFKDDELVSELRRRGYEVKATKTVTIIHEL